VCPLTLIRCSGPPALVLAAADCAHEVERRGVYAVMQQPTGRGASAEFHNPILFRLDPFIHRSGNSLGGRGSCLPSFARTKSAPEVWGV
jgi:hypothetical protein